MANDPYAGYVELDLPVFLHIVQFLKPNCGEHRHFWYRTKSFVDGSNVLWYEGPTYSESFIVGLYDAVLDCVYCSAFTMWESTYTPESAHMLKFASPENLVERVNQKEFIDAFRKPSRRCGTDG